MKNDALTLWRCGERVGRLGRVTTDQPWLYAPIRYDDPEQGALFERVCRFLYVVVEALPDVDDPAEDERRYDEAMRRLDLEPGMVDGFVQGPWVVVRGEPAGDGQQWVIGFHSLREGVLQWRGPMERAFFR